MNEVIICVGISGSGKSTWSSNFIKENPNYLRINRDDIRKTLVGNLDGYYQRKDLNLIERNITRLESEIFINLSIDEFNILIDNTNLKESYIKSYLNLARYYEYNIKFKLFDYSLEISKRNVFIRDFAMSEGEAANAFNDPEYYLNNSKLDYIDKQYKDYQLIKEWIIKNYKDKIIK